MFEIIFGLICCLMIQQDICSGLEIVSNTKNSMVQNGSSVTLYCETDIPYQICKWRLPMLGCDFCGIDDQRLSALRSDVPLSTCCDDYFVIWNVTSKLCSITLENVLPIHLGMYTCIVRTPPFSDTSSMFLDVATPAKVISRRLHEDKVNDAKTATFECRALKGYPIPIMKGLIGSCLSSEESQTEEVGPMSWQTKHGDHGDDTKHFQVDIEEKHCGKCFQCEVMQQDDVGNTLFRTVVKAPNSICNVYDYVKGSEKIEVSYPILIDDINNESFAVWHIDRRDNDSIMIDSDGSSQGLKFIAGALKKTKKDKHELLFSSITITNPSLMNLKSAHYMEIKAGEISKIFYFWLNEKVICGNSENLASGCTQCPELYGKESCRGEHCAFVLDDDINYRCTEKKCGRIRLKFTHPLKGSTRQRITIQLDYRKYFIMKGKELVEHQENITLHFIAQNHDKNSFDVTFSSKDGTTYHIYNGFYSLSEEYKVSANIPLCEDTILDTSIFTCSQPAANDSFQYISVDRICDGRYDCYQGEDERICSPSGLVFDIVYYGYFLSITFYVVAGILSFIWRVTKGQFHVEMIKRNNTCMDSIKGMAVDVIKIVKNYSPKSEINFIWTEYPHLIKKLFHPCKKSLRNKKSVLFLFTLSMHEKFRKPCYRLIDKFLEKEYQIHRSIADSLGCIMWHGKERSFLSGWINNVYERNRPVSKFKRNIMRVCRFLIGIIFFRNRTMIYYAKIVIEVVHALLRICFFQFDQVRDFSVILTLFYIDHEILSQKAEENRYSTVGGINYAYLVYYLIFITILNGLWIHLHAHSKTKDIGKTFGIVTNSRFIGLMVRCFPIHFCILECTYFKIKNEKIFFELENLLNESLNEHSSLNGITEQVLKFATELETNHEHMFLAEKFFTELNSIENTGERELQITAQTILFINSRFFPRILTLFSEMFGLDIKYVFSINWICTILTISNGIIRYQHSKRYPFSPGVFGKIIQPLAVISLVTTKIVFISVSLVNAPYFHIMGHVLKMAIMFVISKQFTCFSSTTFDCVAGTSTASAFFHPNMVDTHASLKKCLGCKGGIITTFLLEGLSYFIYGSLGFLVRFLQQQGFINQINLPERDYKNDPWQYLLRKIIVEFSFYHVIAFFLSSFISYATLQLLYYKKGHPKRHVINKRKQRDNVAYYLSGNKVCRTMKKLLRYKNLSIQRDQNVLLESKRVQGVNFEHITDNDFVSWNRKRRNDTRNRILSSSDIGVSNKDKSSTFCCSKNSKLIGTKRKFKKNLTCNELHVVSHGTDGSFNRKSIY